MILKLKINLKGLLFFNILFSMVMNGLFSYSGLPRSLSYLCDIINLIVLGGILVKDGFTIRYAKVLLLPGLFLVLGMFNSVANDVSILLFLYGIRNYFRMFLIFYEAVCLFDHEDFVKLTDLFCKLYPLNFILAIHQFFILGYYMDKIGGMFGFFHGCNAGLNIYMVLVLAITIFKFNAKKTSVWNLLFVIIGNFAMAVFGELKVYFIEFALVCLLYLLITRFSWKKIVITITAFFSIVIATNILYQLYPEWDSFFTVESLFKERENYSNDEDIGRTKAISAISEKFYDNAVTLRSMFGMGLGSAEYSTSISILNSDFYNKYQGLHYMWLSAAFLFIEMGYVGLVVYLAFFVYCGINLYRMRKLCKSDIILYTTVLTVLFAFILFAYNASLRSDYGYMIFAILAASVPKKSNEIIMRQEYA